MAKEPKAPKESKAKASGAVTMKGAEDVESIAVALEDGTSVSYAADKGTIEVHPDHVTACERAGYRVAE